MKSMRFMLMLTLLVLPARFALAQEAPMGEAVGEGDQPIGGEEVEGEAAGEEDEPMGDDAVEGEPAGEGDEPIGGEPLY